MPGEEEKPERRVYERAFTEAPEAIVRDGSFVLGCFDGPAARANMLDIAKPYHYGVPRWVKDFRCKEWRAFQFGDSRFFFFTALYEAKSFGLALFHVWDRDKKRAYEIKRLLPLRRLPPWSPLHRRPFRLPNRRPRQPRLTLIFRLALVKFCASNRPKLLPRLRLPLPL